MPHWGNRESFLRDKGHPHNSFLWRFRFIWRLKRKDSLLLKGNYLRGFHPGPTHRSKHGCTSNEVGYVSTQQQNPTAASTWYWFWRHRRFKIDRIWSPASWFQKTALLVTFCCCDNRMKFKEERHYLGLWFQRESTWGWRSLTAEDSTSSWEIPSPMTQRNPRGNWKWEEAIHTRCLYSGVYLLQQEITQSPPNRAPNWKTSVSVPVREPIERRSFHSHYHIHLLVSWAQTHSSPEQCGQVLQHKEPISPYQLMC